MTARRETTIEKAVIRELVIEDVDPSESDDELWAWMLRAVFLPSGIESTPWTRESLKRDRRTRSATVSLYIELEQGQDSRPAAN